MPLAVTLVLVAIAGGAVASHVYDRDAGLTVRLGYGAVTGFLVLAFGGLIAALIVGMGAAPAVAGTLAALPLLGLANPTLRRRVARDIHELGETLERAVREPSLATTGPVVFAVAVAALLWIAFDRVIIEEDGTLATGFVNNLGDLPFHLGIVSSFVYGGNLPPENPIYAGTGFSYPYAADFSTALLVQLGASLRDAFFLQNLVLGLALVAVFMRFAYLLTRDRLASFVAPLILLFSGGAGWLLLFDHARAGEQGILAVLGSLPQDYTLTGDGPLRWGNMITTLLVTQRSLALGLPAALIVFIVLWRFVREERAWPVPAMPRRGSDLVAILRRHRLPIVAAILTGLMPLVHAHTFGVVLGTAFLLGLVFREWRHGRWFPWAVYVVVTLLIAIPLVLWSTAGSESSSSSFFGIELWWDHREFDPLGFWLANTGLFIPAAIVTAAWLWSRRHEPGGSERTALLLVSAIFVVWFIVPNVFRLAPWIWDNIKVLVYWFVGLTPLVALGVATILRRGGAWRGAGVAVVLALTLSGALDVWRVASAQTKFGEFDADALAVAEILRTETDPRAIVLHAPTWNAPVFLTGRRSLMGYGGHLWSSGVNYYDREAEIKRIYAGEADAQALLDRYEVDYVVLSPMERTQLTVNEGFFEAFPVLGRSGEYTIHEVPRS